MGTSPRILFVATYPSPGMIPFAAGIINAFYEAGHETWALTVSNRTDSFSKLLLPGIHLTEWPGPSSIIQKIAHHFRPAKAARAICDIADKNHITNIHFLTGEYGFALYRGKALARQYNLVYTLHDLEKHPENPQAPLKEKLFNQYFHWATMRLVRIAHTITSSSKNQCQQVQTRFPHKKVVFHEFPSLVTQRIKQGTRTIPELKGIDNYILFFGTYTLYKGVDLLYRAFIRSGLQEKCQLVMAGAGRDFFSMDTSENRVIRINRFLDDEEIADLFKKARFVACPYIQVTQSGVISIAHYFGKRVVASSLPFFVDNINENDRLFPPGDVEALTKSLKLMYDEAALPCATTGDNNSRLVAQLLEAYR